MGNNKQSIKINKSSGVQIGNIIFSGENDLPPATAGSAPTNTLDLKKLVSENRIAELLTALKRDPALLNEVLLIEGRLNQLNHAQTIGTIAFDDYETALNRIRKSLLDLIEKGI